MKNNFDENKTPVVAMWETTQACDVPRLDYGDLVQPKADPLELNTLEALQLIDEMAELCPPIFILTGADPLKRKDITNWYSMRRSEACILFWRFLQLRC
jgi:MoaA/NifB/PqqE/SkfB family radical SAM enzyme